MGSMAVEQDYLRAKPIRFIFIHDVYTHGGICSYLPIYIYIYSSTRPEII